jgi:hypothetical protein
MNILHSTTIYSNLFPYKNILFLNFLYFHSTPALALTFFAAAAFVCAALFSFGSTVFGVVYRNLVLRVTLLLLP